MDKILINDKFYETRVAYLKENRLFYYFNENKSDISIVGNIYKGKVTRVLPGLQSAFIDIGQEKAAFLHVSDLFYQHISRDDIENPVSEDTDISELISVNDELLVQVSKDPISTKGPRIVTLLSIPGRFLVFFPIGNKVGISKKIESESERQRLKRIIENYKPKDTAFIVRTAAEGISEELIENDMRICMQQWINIVKKQKKVKAPALLYEDLILPLKIARDMLNNNVSEMIIDNEDLYNKVIEFVDEFMPSQKNKIKLYDNRQVELFKKYNVEEQIKKLDNKSVPLKSGGNIIIEQVEAMTVVDVNTGSFVGKNLNHDDTILQTNKEAMEVIAEQIRLRNLGGIIIVDFIDMKSDADKEILIKYAEAVTKDDRANVTIHGITKLGLMQITRKRISDSLRRTSTVTCSLCQGRGTIKTHETITHEIYQKIIEHDKSYLKNKIIEVTVNEELYNYINSYQKNNINKLKERYGLANIVFIKSDKHNHGDFNISVKTKELPEIKEINFNNEKKVVKSNNRDKKDSNDSKSKKPSRKQKLLKDEYLEKSVKYLKEGKVIVFPAETLYGFSCSFYAEDAIDKIFELKQREKTKQFITLVGSFEMAKDIAEIEDYKLDFLREYKYWPNHLTIIFKSKSDEYETLALRYSKAPYFKKLFKKIDFPIISTSVNYSNMPPMTDIKKIIKEFENKVDYINPALPEYKGKASTIIDFSGKEIKLIREGNIKFKKILKDYERFSNN